jgi:hypothetical protein
MVTFTSLKIDLGVFNVRPCPCCGEDRGFTKGDDFLLGLFIGPTMATQMGVECYSCGLKMVRDWPDRTPRGCKTLDDVSRYTLNKAVRAWNRRVKEKR